jgi:hypothetical protein
LTGRKQAGRLSSISILCHNDSRVIFA